MAVQGARHLLGALIWRSANNTARFLCLQELTSVRMELHKCQTAGMHKDAELERRNVEVASLQSDKASLDKLLQVGAGCWVLGCVPAAWAVLQRSRPPAVL